MKRRFLSVLAAVTLLASFGVVLPTMAASSNQVANNVAPWLKDAKLTGRANGNGRIGISVYLQLQNEQALQTLIRNLYTPGSAQYRKFLTPEQFRAAYAPATANQQAVKDFLSLKGLKVEYVPSNGMYVDVSGTIAQIEKAFAITENQYDYKGKNLRANAQAPTVPGNLAPVIAFIGGLDESEQLVQPAIRRDTPDAPPGEGYATPGPCSTYWADHTATVTPQAYQYGSKLPWTVCGYTPTQIRAAYGVDKTGLTGKGVRIGITDAFASPTIVQDVNRFSANYGLPQLTSSNFQQIVVPGIYNFPENRFDPQGWYGEESLDVEWVHAMAPDATIVYAGANNSNAPLDHALIQMIDNHLVDIVTNSWGYTGEPNQYGHVQATERAFMQAAAEGISVLFSSGDEGDVAAATGIAQASYPASSSYVTAVGGTSLAVYDASGGKDEWGWGTYGSTLQGSTTSANGTVVTGTGWSPWPPTYRYGSGGGVSLHFPQPSYQAGVVPNSLSTRTTTASGQPVTLGTPHRVVPDISMVADPNTGVLVGETYKVSGDPLIDAGCTPLGNNLEYCERRIGGTSLSSPLFAGVLALVDQARFQAGRGAVGFVNPLLYNGTPIGGPHSMAAIEDVLPPSSPTAVLRNAGATGTTTTLRTINSTVDANGNVIEGADSSLRTTPNYDDVTGLGAPWAPAFVQSLQTR